MKKTVRVSCHEPIAIDPSYEQTWSDVYLSFKTRPGRVHYYGPTLRSRTDLERELEMTRELQNDRPDLDFKADIVNYEQILKSLQDGQLVVHDEKDADDGVPTLYTASLWIDRAEAERMIRFWMTHKGFSNVKLRWKRPVFTVLPW